MDAARDRPVVDVFDVVAQHSQHNSEEHEASESDSELLFVGAKQSGKSTIIHSFLMKDEAPKPTTALEYRFARRSTGPNFSQTSVANIWELGGGTQLSELLRTVLLPQRLSRCVVAITLDMSEPGEALGDLLFWLKETRTHVDAALNQLRSRPEGAGQIEAVRQRIAAVWDEHPDSQAVRPMEVSLVVLAHKWDEFEARYGEAEYRKLATRTLRFFAHQHGASFLCCKHKDKLTMSQMRHLFFHLTFNTPPLTTAQLEYSKPLCVPAALDAFDLIGKPPLVEGVLSNSDEERWKGAYRATFPPKEDKKESQDLSMVEAEQFAEECIDVLRVQKRNELEKLRREARLGDMAPINDL